MTALLHGAGAYAQVIKNSIGSYQEQETDVLKTDHLPFMGKEITGNENEMREYLKGKGFKDVKNKDGKQVLKGKFATMDATINFGIYEGNLYTVAVTFENKSSWKKLEEDFNTLRDNLIKKYGKPKERIEQFSFPYRRGDGYEIKAVHYSKCLYKVLWELREGYVMLMISPSEKEYLAHIALIYTDGEAIINMTNKQLREQKQIINDL